VKDDAREILREINFLLREGVDPFSSEPEATLRTVRLLAASAAYLNRWLLDTYGGHPGEDRGMELLEQIVAAPFQTFAGEELHPDPFEKAAMLLRGIVQGHPFGDGNKRAGFAVAAYYLDLIGFSATEVRDQWNEDDVYEFVYRISAGETSDIDAIAGQLRELWRAGLD